MDDDLWANMVALCNEHRVAYDEIDADREQAAYDALRLAIDKTPMPTATTDEWILAIASINSVILEGLACHSGADVRDLAAALGPNIIIRVAIDTESPEVVH